jgi:hypothetical protein
MSNPDASTIIVADNPRKLQEQAAWLWVLGTVFAIVISAWQILSVASQNPNEEHAGGTLHAWMGGHYGVPASTFSMAVLGLLAVAWLAENAVASFQRLNGTEEIEGMSQKFVGWIVIVAIGGPTCVGYVVEIAQAIVGA